MLNLWPKREDFDWLDHHTTKNTEKAGGEEKEVIHRDMCTVDELIFGTALK